MESTSTSYRGKWNNNCSKYVWNPVDSLKRRGSINLVYYSLSRNWVNNVVIRSVLRCYTLPTVFTFRYCENFNSHFPRSSSYNNLSSKVYIIYSSIYKYVIICKSQSQTVFLDWFNFFLKARRRSLRKTISSRLSRGESARHPDASRDIRSLSGSARLSLGDKEAEDSPDFPATRTTSDPCTTSSSASCTSTCETFHSLQLERKKYTSIYKI